MPQKKLVSYKNLKEKKQYILITAGSFKSQLIDYFRGHIVSWDKPLQFYVI